MPSYFFLSLPLFLISSLSFSLSLSHLLFFYLTFFHHNLFSYIPVSYPSSIFNRLRYAFYVLLVWFEHFQSYGVGVVQGVWMILKILITDHGTMGADFFPICSIWKALMMADASYGLRSLKNFEKNNHVFLGHMVGFFQNSWK